MAKKRVVEQYRGALSPGEVAAGMNAAMRNARRLLDDAKLLFKEGRTASACSLAILSIEEAGKRSLLRQIATAPNGKALKSAWQAYRDHQAKNVAWIIGDLVQKGAKTLRDLKAIVDPKSDHPAVLEAAKQLSFYTDCLGDRHWSEPFDFAEEEFTKSIIWVAGVLCSNEKNTSSREIELWVQIVGSAANLKTDVPKLIAYYEALENEGLAIGQVEGFKTFVLGDEE